MVNRTNNAMESYNGRFNCKFSKQPNIIKFNQIVMEELIRQAETLQNIRTVKKLETVRQNVFVPDIPEEYHSFKDYVDSQDKGTRKGHKKTANPSKTWKRAKTANPAKSDGKGGRGMRMQMSMKFPPLPAHPWERWTGRMGATIRSASSNKRN